MEALRLIGLEALRVRTEVVHDLHSTIAGILLGSAAALFVLYSLCTLANWFSLDQLPAPWDAALLWGVLTWGVWFCMPRLGYTEVSLTALILGVLIAVTAAWLYGRQQQIT